MNFPGKRALSVFQYSNYLPLCQNQKKSNEPFLRKLSDGHAKNYLTSLFKHTRIIDQIDKKIKN